MAEIRSKFLFRSELWLPVLIVQMLLLTIPVRASDLIEVLPLTRDIVMLHFYDGYVIYHKNGQPRSNEKAVVVTLQAAQAQLASNYQIYSTDDAAYTNHLSPVSVGRKSKGSEFTWLCQGWNATTGCINTDPDRVQEHWIYLVLPAPLQQGKTYTIKTGSLAENGSEWNFTFDVKMVRSEAIHVNMIGYAPAAPGKFGYVYHWMGDLGGLDLSSFVNTDFHLVDTRNNETVFSGKLAFRKSKTNPETGQTTETPNANFSSAEVYECDFSAFSTPGEYILTVDGIGSSFPFRIDADVYRMPFYTAIRGLYHNRSGIALTQPFTEFTRNAPHNPNITPGFAGKLRYTSSRFVDWQSGDNDPDDKPAIEAGDKGLLNTWGWYQDAGDWDGYYTHLNIPCMLMFTWEAAPGHFRDNELNIPESGNGIPDILDEASWLLRFFYRTRHEIIDREYGTGGIGSRVFGDLWGSDEAPNGTGRGSWQDNTRTWYVSGEDPFTTYKYAALAAQMAFCLKTAGLTDTIDWDTEAIESYDWAKDNTLEGDESTKPAIGYPLKDIRAFAAASLFRLTGNVRYQDELKPDASAVTSATILRDEARWAPYIFASMPDSLPADNDLVTRFRGAVLATADLFAATADTRACRFGGDFYMPMLMGQSTTPIVFEVIMGYKLAKAEDQARAGAYLSCLYTTSDYFLGCNPLNTTWITGLGIRQPNRVFHMDSWYNGKTEMAPGITPYGPWRDESWATGMGAWDLKWPHKTLYPAGISSWPGHERWFGNYTCPLNAEFTVHQNTILNAATFGFLCNKASKDFVANKRPQISFIFPDAGSVQTDTVHITVNASDPDGNTTIYKVEYYNDRHKIGETFQAPYSLNWHNTVGGMLKLTARIVDNYGMVGRTDTLVINSIINDISYTENDDVSIKAYPNPFSSEITIEYSLKNNCHLSLEIYDMLGKKINSLRMAYQKAGFYHIIWDGTDANHLPVSPGAYICRFENSDKPDSEINSKNILMLKNR
jgi:endoglucanase